MFCYFSYSRVHIFVFVFHYGSFMTTLASKLFHLFVWLPISSTYRLTFLYKMQVDEYFLGSLYIIGYFKEGQRAEVWRTKRHERGGGELQRKDPASPCDVSFCSSHFRSGLRWSTLYGILQRFSGMEMWRKAKDTNKDEERGGLRLVLHGLVSECR